MLTLLLACGSEPADSASTADTSTEPVPGWSGTLWSTAIYDDQVRRTSLEDGEQEVVETCASPIGVVAHPASGTVLTSCHQASQVDIIDMTSATVTASVAVGGLPYWIDRVGDHVLVANSGDGTFSLIDPEAGSVVRTLEVPGSPIAFDVRDDDTLLVADYLGDRISAVDVDDGEVLWQSDPVALPVWVLHHGGSIYVAESRDDTVAVLDETGALVDRFEVGATPTAILIVTRGGTESLLVLFHTGDALGLYDPSDHTPLAELALPGSPIGATLVAEGLAVALASSDELALVDLEELRIEHRLPAGDGPRGLAWLP